MAASKIDVTPAAAKHGPLVFHQSGGCCDGSSPMCYSVGMVRTGRRNVHLGDLDAVAAAASRSRPRRASAS